MADYAEVRAGIKELMAELAPDESPPDSQEVDAPRLGAKRNVAPETTSETETNEADKTRHSNEGETSPSEVSANATISKARAELLEVPLEIIDCGPNIRKSDGFDLQDEEDANLVASVKDGNQQPGLARRKADGRFELLFGFRRFYARKAANCPTMLLMVTDEELTPEEVIEKQLIENCQRKNMNPMDRAEAYAALKKRYKKACLVAEKVALPENVLSEYLTVESHLPAESKKKLREGKLTFKAAYEEAKAKKEGKGRHKNKPSAAPDSTTQNGEDTKTSPSEVSALDNPISQKCKHIYDPLGFSDDTAGLVFVVAGKRKAPPTTEKLVEALKKWLSVLEATDNHQAE